MLKNLSLSIYIYMHPAFIYNLLIPTLLNSNLWAHSPPHSAIRAHHVRLHTHPNSITYKIGQTHVLHSRFNTTVMNTHEMADGSKHL